VRAVAVCDDLESKILESKILESKIQTLRGQLVELASTIRKLDRSGLGSARAQLLLSRKRAELEDLIKEDLMKRGRSDAVRCAQMVRPQCG
jgi:hypothetical protein